MCVDSIFNQMCCVRPTGLASVMQHNLALWEFPYHIPDFLPISRPVIIGNPDEIYIAGLILYMRQAWGYACSGCQRYDPRICIYISG
jgi:hypothetical protein